MWILFSAPAFAGMPQANPPTVIECFTGARYPMHGLPVTVPQHHPLPLKITVYAVDALEINERALSFKLSHDPKQSSRMALARIKHLDAQARAGMRSTAQGLLKARQHGIDRIPAIVFDGVAVVYGVSDLRIALEHYQSWRAGR